MILDIGTTLRIRNLIAYVKGYLNYLSVKKSIKLRKYIEITFSKKLMDVRVISLYFSIKLIPINKFG